MKRYLCPVCEQELTGRSYCRTCRKIVREPMIYDGVLPNEDRGDYLVNHEKNHPGRQCVEANRERICKTPQEIRAAERFSRTPSGTTNSGTVYKEYVPNQSTAPGSQIWKGSSVGGSNTYRSAASGSLRTEPRKKKGCRAGCLVIVLVIWLIGILGELVSEIDIDSWLAEEWFAGESIDWTPEESVDPGENWEEVDYDEILKAGKPCDGYWHYHLDGDKVYDTLADFARGDLKLTMTESSEWMENGISRSEYGTYSYYDTFCYWDWQDGYFGVTSDSVNEEIHYISVYGSDGETVFALAVKAIELVEDAETATTIGAQLGEMNKNGKLDGGVYLSFGDSELWAEVEDDGWYYIEVYPVTE